MKKESILIVDDVEDMLSIIAGVFEDSFVVHQASCAKEALNILATKEVDLIISDVVMPQMDGFDFCKTVKSDPKYSLIPIVLLTAQNIADAKIVGLETGADIFIEKPFSKQVLLAQVHSLLKNRSLIKQTLLENPLAQIEALSHDNAHNQFLGTLTKIILDNLADPNLTVDFLARQTHMSRMTLYRKVLASTNITPNELIHVLRMKKALSLIKENKYRLFEIALYVGYADQSSFTRSFQAHYKIAPSEYIKKLRKDKGTHHH